ncbi:hypothetical protein SCITRI_00930 [Spiroplasma citri]|nr:hypothetical protein SCITRI_00930 [Spiroplasma citri]
MTRSLKESVKAIRFNHFISLILGGVSRPRNVRACVFGLFHKKSAVKPKKTISDTKKQEGGAPKGYFLYIKLCRDGWSVINNWINCFFVYFRGW